MLSICRDISECFTHFVISYKLDENTAEPTQVTLKFVSRMDDYLANSVVDFKWNTVDYFIFAGINFRVFRDALYARNYFPAKKLTKDII